MEKKTRNWPQQAPKIDQRLGKVPPQAPDAERVILGTLIRNNRAFENVSDQLTPEMFYIDMHQEVYRAIVRMRMAGLQVDEILLLEELKKGGPSGLKEWAYSIMQLSNNAASPEGIIQHALLVREKFIARRMIEVCMETVNEAFDPQQDPLEALDALEKKVTEISINNVAGEMIDMETALMRTAQKMEERAKLEGVVTGVPTGFRGLDTCTRGWQPGDFIIIAARPSVGKTALALTLAINAAKKGVAVAIWSMEMKVEPLMERTLAFETEVLFRSLQDGKLNPAEKEAVRRQMEFMSRLPIKISEVPGITIGQLKSQARRHKRKDNLGLIILDYIQLMKGDPSIRQTREQEISSISRGVKELCLELQIPIIALAQLSREVEKRATSKPQLSDLRESGSLEMDADVVGLLWQPTDEEKEKDPELINRRYFKIAKQRNGSLMTFDAEFIGKIQKFVSMEERSPSFIKLAPAEGKGFDFSKAKTQNKELFEEPSDDLPF